MKWSFLLLVWQLMNVKYPIEVLSCDTSIQIQYQGQIRSLEVFNIEIRDMKEVCLLLTNRVVEIEFEPYIQQEPLSAWIFVDGELLQQMIVDKQLGTVTRDNPLYTYKLEKQVESVSATLHEPILVNRDRGYRIVLVCFLLWVVSVLLVKKAKY